MIHFLFELGHSNESIHQELMKVYKDKALSKKAVEYWTHEFRIGRKTIEDAPRSGRPPDPKKRSLVQALIENDPFITARQIAREAGISPTIVINILTKELGYNYLHLRWIPHRLTFEMKKRRIEQSRVILDHLQTANRGHFTNIITGDESWFLYLVQPKARWVLAGDDPGEIVIGSNYQKKSMVSIFIKKNGTFFVDLMPNGQKFNSEYFVNSIVPQINSLAYPDGYKFGRKKCLLHFDNAPSHKSHFILNALAKLPFNLIPNPEYSPDVSPLDFGVLGTIKNKMPYESIDSEEALKEIIEEILNDLGSDFIMKVFQAWEERLQEVINIKGEYIK